MKKFILAIYILIFSVSLFSQIKVLNELDLSLSLRQAVQSIKDNKYQSYQNYKRYIHWVAVIVRQVKLENNQSGFLLMDAEWLETDEIVSYRFVLTTKDSSVLKQIENCGYNEKAIIIGKLKNVIDFQNDKIWEIDAVYVKKI